MFLDLRLTSQAVLRPTEEKTLNALKYMGVKMKYKVTIDNQVKEYENLDEAVEIIKHASSKLTVGAVLAASAGNDALREKNIKTRDSIKLEIVGE